MDVSLPSYEAAMRDARAYLRRRDLSSQDEVPLYFAWERLYAAANANLSTDFFHETSAERRARQQARLAPRRGLPPPLFTSFDKVNRRSAQASAFLRSDSSSDVAIEMMARRYRREAEKLRSSRENLGVGSLDDAGKRLKKDKRRQKSPELEVEELLEAIGHSKVLPNGKTGTSAMTGRKIGLASNKSDGIEFDVTAAKAAELKGSSFSMQNPAVIPSLSNAAGVAAFAARVTDWRMPSDIDATSPSSKLLKKKDMSTSGKRLGEANELRGSVPVEDGEGDMTFDTSFGSSGFDEDSVESELAGTSSADQMNRRRTKRDGVDEADAEVNQEQQASKRGTPGKKPEDLSTAATDAGMNQTTAQQHLAEDHDTLADTSEFQQKLVQLSHAVGDMQVKIQGKQIEVTFKGALNDTSNTDAKDGEALTSAIRSTKSTQPSVAQKVFDTAGSRNDDGGDEGGGVGEQEGGAQWAETGISAKASATLARKQSSVRFTDMESRDHNGEDDRLSEHELNVLVYGQRELHSTSASRGLNVQEDRPRRITNSSARNMTRSTAETELSDEKIEAIGDQRSSSELQRCKVNDEEADLDADEFRANTSNRSPQKDASRNEAQEVLRSTSQRQHPDEYLRRQSDHTDSVPIAIGGMDTHSQSSRGRADSSSTRSQGIPGDDQTYTRTDTQYLGGDDIFVEEHSLEEHNQNNAESRRDTTTATDKTQSRADSSSTRSQDRLRLDEQPRPRTDAQHEVECDIFIEEQSLLQSRRDTTTCAGRSDPSSQSYYGRVDSSGSRPQDIPGLDEQPHTHTDTQHDAQGDISIKEQSLQEHDQHREQPRRDTTITTGRNDPRSQTSRGRADSSSFRPQGVHGRDKQPRTRTDTQRGVEGELFEEHSLKEHDQHLALSNRDTRATTAKSDTPLQSSRGHTDSSTIRSQDRADLENQNRTRADTEHDFQGELIDEHSLQEHEQHRAHSRRELTTATTKRDTRLQSSRDRVNSSSTRSQDKPGLEGQTRTRTDTQHDVGGDIITDEHSSLRYNQHRATHRQSRRNTKTSNGVRECRPSTTRRESDAPRSRRDLNRSMEPSDDENGVGITSDGEIESSDEVRISGMRSSGRSNDEYHRIAHYNRPSSSKTRERSVHRVPKAHDRYRASVHVTRRSRNQLEELVDDEFYSDEELSDGPDNPYRQPQQQRGRHDSNRQQSRVSDDSGKSLTQNSSKRPSSRSVSRHVKSHSKRRSYSSESSADSDAMNSSDYDSLEEQSSDRHHSHSRSRTAQRSQPHHSTSNRHDQPQSSKKSTRSRDHPFLPVTDYSPKLSKPDIRLKRDNKSKSESRSKESAGRPRKLPEGIVWPPGMEEECIARLGLDGLHPMAPPGLEHLVTEEQWGDYWTWLHWYSSWQMWYMKNDKKPKRKSNKGKQSGRRRVEAYDSPHNGAEYHEKHPQNANWRLDVGLDKHHRRRTRVE